MLHNNIEQLKILLFYILHTVDNFLRCSNVFPMIFVQYQKWPIYSHLGRQIYIFSHYICLSITDLILSESSRLGGSGGSALAPRAGYSGWIPGQPIITLRLPFPFGQTGQLFILDVHAWRFASQAEIWTKYRNCELRLHKIIAKGIICFIVFSQIFRLASVISNISCCMVYTPHPHLCNEFRCT